MGFDNPAAEAAYDRRQEAKARERVIVRGGGFEPDVLTYSRTVYLPIIQQTTPIVLNNPAPYSPNTFDPTELAALQCEAIRTGNREKLKLLLGARSINELTAQTLYHNEIPLLLDLYRLALEKARAVFIQIRDTLGEAEALKAMTERNNDTTRAARSALYQEMLSLQKTHRCIVNNMDSFFNKEGYQCAWTEVLSNIFRLVSQRLPNQKLAQYYQANPPSIVNATEISRVLQSILSDEYSHETESYLSGHPNERAALTPFVNVDNSQNTIDSSVISLALEEYEKAIRRSPYLNSTQHLLERIIERNKVSFNLSMLAKHRGDWHLLTLIFRHYSPLSIRDMMIRQIILTYCQERKNTLGDWDKLAYLATKMQTTSLENSFLTDELLKKQRMNEASLLLDTIKSQLDPSPKVEKPVSTEKLPPTPIRHDVFKDETIEREMEKHNLKKHGLGIARRLFNEEVDRIKAGRKTNHLEKLTAEELSLAQGNFVIKSQEDVTYQEFLQIFSKKFPNDASSMLPASLKNANIADLEKESLGAFEVAGNRYHLMMLKYELERIQKKSPAVKKTKILKNTITAIQQELSKPTNTNLVYAINYTRSVSEILEANSHHDLQKELSQWQKQTYSHITSLPNHVGLAKSAAAIAYIYQDYLRWGKIDDLGVSPECSLEIFALTSYEECIEFFNKPENYDKSKKLYQCFTQHRSSFESYYVSPLSYQNKWYKVLQTELIQVMLSTSEREIGRLFNTPNFEHFDNVLVPNALLNIVNALPKFAQEKGKDTDSMYMTQLMSYQKILLCYQELFFKDSTFFDVFFQQLSQCFSNDEIKYKQFFLKFFPSSNLSIQQYQELLKTQIVTSALTQGIFTLAMRNDASGEKAIVQMILWDYTYKQSIAYSPDKTAEKLLQEAIVELNKTIADGKDSVTFCQQEALQCEELPIKASLAYPHREQDTINQHILSKSFPSYTDNKALEMRKLADLSIKMDAYNLDRIQEEGLTAFELLSNRYHLILLKHELERIQRKLPLEKKSILDQILKDIQQELTKPNDAPLINAFECIRKASEILEDNRCHNFQKEFEKWHKQTYLKIRPLPNSKSLAKAAGAIAYIYWDYLKEYHSLSSYQDCIDYFNNPENHTQAKKLYRRFLQNRSEFENYYAAPTTYKNRWNEVVQKEIVAALHSEKSLSRVFQNPDGLPWVLMPNTLLSLRDECAELAKYEGAKTDSVFITEQVVFQKMLQYFQEQFLKDSTFFSNFFKQLRESFENDERAYLKFIAELFEQDDLSSLQIAQCEENIKITMMTSMLIQPLHIIIEESDASAKRKLAALFLWSDVSKRYITPKLVDPLKNSPLNTNNEQVITRVEPLLEETTQALDKTIAQGKTSANYYQHETDACLALNTVAERVYSQRSDEAKVLLIAKTFPSFSHVKYKSNPESGMPELCFENEKNLINSACVEPAPSTFYQNIDAFNAFIEPVLKNSEHSVETYYHTRVRLLVQPLEQGQFDYNHPPSGALEVGQFSSYYLESHYFKGDYAWGQHSVSYINKNGYCTKERGNHTATYRQGDNVTKNPWVMLCTKTLRHLTNHRIPHCTAKEVLLLATALKYAFSNYKDKYNEPFTGAVTRWPFIILHEIKLKTPPKKGLQAGIVYIHQKNDVIVYSVKSPNGQDILDFPLDDARLCLKINDFLQYYSYGGTNKTLVRDTQIDILFKISKNNHIPPQQSDSFYDSLPEAIRPFSRDEIQNLAKQLPALVHNLIAKNTVQTSMAEKNEASYSHNSPKMPRWVCEQKKMDIIINKIHSLIAYTPELFKEYCRYLSSEKSIEPKEIQFLANHFDTAHSKKDPYDHHSSELGENLFIYLHDIIVQNKVRKQWDERVYGKGRLTESAYEQRKIQTDEAIKKIHKCIVNSENGTSTPAKPTVFKAYCQYLIQAESLEPEEIEFLANNFKKAYLAMDNSRQKQKIFNYVRPVCRRQIEALEQEWQKLIIKPSGCIARLFSENKTEQYKAFYARFRSCYIGFKALIQERNTQNNYFLRFANLEKEVLQKLYQKPIENTIATRIGGNKF